jgi:hypothetical protein
MPALVRSFVSLLSLSSLLSFPSLLLATAALAPAHAAPKSWFLQLVDDHGKAITGEVEVCFQVGTRSDCVSWRGTPIGVPQEFVAVRVEGPDHTERRRESSPLGPVAL